jgi:hypothetical protein
MRLTSEIYHLSSIADFMAGDSDLWVTSRFEKLHLINLLHTQHRLSRLEEEVNDHILYEQHLIGHAPHPKPTRPSDAVFADLQAAIVAYSICTPPYSPVTSKVFFPQETLFRR